MQQSLWLDVRSPINWQNSLMAGLVSRWKNLPGGQWGRGTMFRDLNRAKSNDGTLTSGPTWAGSLGLSACYGSILFDGSNDYVSVLDNDSLDIGVSDSFTLATFFKVTGENGAFENSNIITKGSADSGNPGYELFRRRSGAGASPNTLQAFFTDGTNTANPISSITVTDGAWYFGSVVFDRAAATAQIHINGNASGSSVSIASVGSLVNANVLAFGSSSVTTRRFTGYLDNVVLIKRALSVSENAALYQSFLRPDDPTLNWIDLDALTAPAGAPGGDTASRARYMPLMGAA